MMANTLFTATSVFQRSPGKMAAARSLLVTLFSDALMSTG
jgi:hypothetical protein